MQDVSIKPDGDNAGHRTECPDPASVGARYDDVEHARSPLREEVQDHWTRRFDELKENVQKLQEEFVAGERGRQKQHEEVMCMLRTLQRDQREHSTPPMDPIDPLSFTQDPSNIQRDIGHHFTPLMDPIDPPSFTHDPSDIQRDRGHHSTPPMDPIDPPSFNQDPSEIQCDSEHHFTPPVDPIDPPSLS
ncbi:hypothetical protein Q3G72_004847 [Acer saccharum]|nr:hypothetical protein Q3G72_004847 [Acer saccharum]